MPTHRESLGSTLATRLFERAELADLRDTLQREKTGGGAPVERLIGRISRKGAEVAAKFTPEAAAVRISARNQFFDLEMAPAETLNDEAINNPEAGWRTSIGSGLNLLRGVARTMPFAPAQLIDHRIAESAQSVAANPNEEIEKYLDPADL